MKNALILGVTAALTLTSAALADAGPRGGRMADRDGDGKVTLADTEAASKTRFARMDKNKDGKVTKEEMAAVRAERAEAMAKRREARAGKAEGRGDRMFGLIDRNGDGVLSQTEFDEAGKARFQRLDANKDGVLSPEERAAARDARRGR